MRPGGATLESVHRLGNPRDWYCGSTLGKTPHMLAKDPRVSVVIACHTQERFDLLVTAVESTLAQEPQPLEIIISVDHEASLFRRVSERFPELTVVENALPRGASGTRNTGAAQTTTPIVAFLDDDASAHPGWLAALIEPFDNPSVVCTGGFVAPNWSEREPQWFPDEFAWVVGASHRGLPTSRARVRNVWSENMAVRSEVFREVGGFRLDFGKVGAVSRPEDTDLCIRLGKSRAGAEIVYVPEAKVNHRVGPERTHFGFFIKRCYFEGRGKVELARHNDGNDDLGDERTYLSRTIPQGVYRNLREGTTERDVNKLRRAGAIVSGVISAGSGAVVSLIRH